MYTIIVDKPAKKFIDKLPKPDRARIADALEKLPDNGDIKELKDTKDGSGCALALTALSTRWTMAS